jgi:hypothetical protein
MLPDCRYSTMYYVLTSCVDGTLFLLLLHIAHRDHKRKNKNSSPLRPKVKYIPACNVLLFVSCYVLIVYE